MRSLLFPTVFVGCLLFAADHSLGTAAETPVRVNDAGPATAVQEKKPPLDLTAQLKKKLASIDLPPDVLAQANKIVDEYGPQYVAYQVKRYSILTEEQKAIHKAKLKENSAAGKSGADILDGMIDALKFTQEQKKQWDDIQAKKRAIGIAMNDALRGVLNSEQQARYGLPKKQDSDKYQYEG
jgi:hypothetical protein